TERFTLVHAGALYQSRNPMNFLAAVRELVLEGAIPTQAFRVQLVGGVPDDEPALRTDLRSEPFRQVVEVIPRVPHGEAVTLQQQANVLVLIQTGYPLQIPRKLYEYLSFRRPILAIADTPSATAAMINELRAGTVCADDISEIKGAIAALYQAWR